MQKRTKMDSGLVPVEPGQEAAQQAILGALRALAGGDFSVRLPVDEPGSIGEISSAFNEVAELSERTSRELRRTSRVVGRQGQMSVRSSVPGTSGGWAQNVEAVNGLIEQLTEPAMQMSRVLGAVAAGDLSQRMPLDVAGRPLQGEFRNWAEVVNAMVDQLNAFASEVTRVAREVGTEGKLGGQADVRGVGGTWKDLTDSVNFMASNLTGQVRNIAEVTTAVAQGDLSKKITVDVQGEILELKNTVNTMVDQLNVLASEVTRVAHEVGTEGKLGGQAEVPGVAGIWKQLTDNINVMSRNLTDRARNIAEVTTAVAQGDLTKKITVTVRGEFQEQKKTINTMVDQLNAFASELTRVAREVARAAHFRADHAVGAVLDHLHRAGEGFGEARPAGARFEFGVAGEERISTAGTAIGAVVLDVEVRSAKRSLSPVLAKDRVLLGREPLPPLFVGLGEVLGLGHVGLQSALRGFSIRPNNRQRDSAVQLHRISGLYHMGSKASALAVRQGAATRLGLISRLRPRSSGWPRCRDPRRTTHQRLRPRRRRPLPCVPCR
jgi:HAMP domain-containing protein